MFVAIWSLLILGWLKIVLVRSSLGRMLIGSVQCQGHRIVCVGAKDNRALRGRGAKKLAPQDSTCSRHTSTALYETYVELVRGIYISNGIYPAPACRQAFMLANLGSHSVIVAAAYIRLLPISVRRTNKRLSHIYITTHDIFEATQQYVRNHNIGSSHRTEKGKKWLMNDLLNVML